MIDLDREIERLETPGGERLVRVGGAVIVLLPVARMGHVPTRGGLIGIGLGVCRWIGRVIGTTSKEDALRREVLACVAPGDAEGRAAVRTMSVFHLGTLYAFIQQRVSGVMRSAAEAAGRAGAEAQDPRPKTVHGGFKGRSTAGDAAFPLRVGERLPWFMGGGAWGKAYADSIAGGDGGEAEQTNTGTQAAEVNRG